MLAAAFRNRLCWFESHSQHISLCSPCSWTHASSSLQKQTVGSSPTLTIFLYVAQAVERMLAVAFRKKLCWLESHYGHIFLCSWGNTQHSQKTGIHAPTGIQTHNLSRRGSTVRPAMLGRVPLLAYFFMYPYNWKHLLKWIVERASMIGVLGTQGGFVPALFQGGVGEWNTFGKCAALISAFETSS